MDKQEISRCTKQVILILRCSVLTAPLTPYSPKDQIESVYRLKADLKSIALFTLKVVEDILIDYIQTTLNPFLVEWHAIYFDNKGYCEAFADGFFQDVDTDDDDFHDHLLKLRETTANLQTKLEEILDENDEME